MTKADIVNHVNESTGIEKATVQKALGAFMETVKESLAGGNNVYFRGFGSFIVKKKGGKSCTKYFQKYNRYCTGAFYSFIQAIEFLCNSGLKTK